MTTLPLPPDLQAPARTIRLPVLLAVLAAALGLSLRGASAAPDLLTIDNNLIRVGIDRAKGASITWLSSSQHPGNLVNLHDPGRLIQQSYYAGKRLDRKADGQSPAWSPWTWNPIQGGGVASWARVTTFERTADGVLHAVTVPKLWDMPDEEAAAVMRQWTSFEPDMPNVVVVTCEFESQRTLPDQWGPSRESAQEIPACYFIRNLHHVQSYLGGGAWRAEVQPPGPPWGKCTPPLKTVGLFGDNGYGVAIFSPAATQPWNFGPHGDQASDDPQAAPCMHVAPLDRVALAPQSTYRYRYWLILGTKEEIAQRAEILWRKYQGERAVLLNR